MLFEKQAQLDYGDSNNFAFWDGYILDLETRKRELDSWVLSIEDAPLPHQYNISFECWNEYKETGVLPFSGGWLEQPQWLIDDFHYYDLVKELRQLPLRIEDSKRMKAKVLKP
jgi:hypothetical protein